MAELNNFLLKRLKALLILYKIIPGWNLSILYEDIAKIVQILNNVWNNQHFCESNTSEKVRKTNSVFGEGSTSQSTVLFWFAKFRSVDFILENKPRGRPQPNVNNDELKAIVESDTSQTTRGLA